VICSVVNSNLLNIGTRGVAILNIVGNLPAQYRAGMLSNRDSVKTASSLQ
jgi:hypothetical protein